MTSEPNTESFRTNRSLKNSVYDGMAASVMQGVGDNYLSAFAIFLKALPSQQAIVTTLPPLIGSFCQLLALGLMNIVPSRRTLIMAAVAVQAVTWLPMVLVALWLEPSSEAVWAVIGFAALYQVGGNIAGPIWSSLIGDLAPPEERGRYFGFRNQRSLMTTLATLVAAGLTLEWCRSSNQPALGFALLFGTAFLARSLSVFFLSRHEDPPFTPKEDAYFSFWQFLKRAPTSNFTKFVFFVSVFNFAIAVSGPFFAMYMLNDLRLSYLQYTVLTALTVTTQFLTIQHWGRLTDRFGNKKILNIASVGTSSVPLLWLVSSNFAWTMIIQTYAGFFWAGFALSTGNFMFDAVTPQKRARCVAYQALVNSALVFLGSLFGGWLVTNIPDWAPLSRGLFTPESKFFRLFLLSSILRFTTISIFLPLFKEVREVEPIDHKELVFRIVAIRPFNGMTVSIMNGSGAKKTDGSVSEEDR